jgi:hypothetical protein
MLGCHAFGTIRVARVSGAVRVVLATRIASPAHARASSAWSPGLLPAYAALRRRTTKILKEFPAMRPGVLVALALPVDARFLGLRLVDVRA